MGALTRGSTLVQMFGRKYSRIAESFPDAVFLEVFGDESADTRVRPPTARLKP